MNSERTITVRLEARHVRQIILTKKSRGDASRMLNNALVHFRYTNKWKKMIADGRKTLSFCFKPTKENATFLHKMNKRVSMSSVVNAALDL